MNKHCYKHVWNKARSALMAVSENSNSRSTGRVKATTVAATFLLASNFIAAQIAADAQAPKVQQATIITVPNGVPMVNIQTPSAAGVSRNTYSQFDVNNNGVILNNSRTNVQTQLGGLVQGNPWLATGSARVILNEVNSSHPSQLKGYVEVAGQKAQVIIANSAGITCDGCGFINANRATLTTGAAVINGGSLDGYRVTGGSIAIQGVGLDARSADYAEIITRAAQVNAGIWAKEIKTILGVNEIKLDTSGAPSVSGQNTPTDAAPKFALDIGLLGGMYANNIFLIGTEEGLGVTHAGKMYAGIGEIEVTANGDIINKGQINAVGDVSVQAKGRVDNSGSIYAQKNTSLTVQDDINNSGLMAAQIDANLIANGVNSNIISSGQLASGLDVNSNIGTMGNLNINATQGITATNQAVSGASLTMNAGSLNLTKLQASAANTLTLNTLGALISDGAKLKGGFITATSKTISNEVGIMVADQNLKLDTQSLTGKGQLLSVGSSQIHIGGDFTSVGKISANKDVALTIDGKLSNQSGIEADRTLALIAQNIDNQRDGAIKATKTEIKVSQSIINHGVINGGDTFIQANSISNLGTGHIYGDHVALGANTLTNDAEAGTSPVVAARNRLDIGAQTIVNNDGSLLLSLGNMAVGGALDGNHQVTGRAVSLTNRGAKIDVGSNLAITAQQVQNLNANLATEIVVVSGPTDISYSIGGETWRDDFYINETVRKTKIKSSIPSQILTGKDITITEGLITNENSQIVAGGVLHIDATKVNHVEAKGEVIAHIEGSHRRSERQGRNIVNGIYEWIDTWSPWAPADVITEFNFSEVKYLANTVTNRTSSNIDIVAFDSVKTISSEVQINGSDSRIYELSSNPSHNYLVETDPRFTNYQQWLSSDYLLNQIGLDANKMQKRLGDGFYEQQMVNEQVIKLTGQRYLGDYSNSEEQYRVLLDNGATVAKKFQLRPDIALTAEQMEQLTSDIVWLVEQDVRLPNGTTTKALVPKLYARAKEGDLPGVGALMNGHSVKLQMSGDMTSSGSIIGKSVLDIKALNIQNLGGTLSGDILNLTVGNDITNQGDIKAIKSLMANAGRDINIKSTTSTQANTNAHTTNINRFATVYVQDGKLSLNAGRDVNVKAALVAGNGKEAVQIASGRDINIKTVNVSSQLDSVADSENYLKLAQSEDVGGFVKGKGGVTLVAINDITIKGSSMDAGEAKVNVKAGRDFTITDGQVSNIRDEAHAYSSSDILSSSSVKWRDKTEQTQSIGSSIRGGEVNVESGRNGYITGSNFDGSSDENIKVGENLTLAAGVNTSNELHTREESSSGVSISGNGLFLWSTNSNQSQQSSAQTAAVTQIFSQSGNVHLAAGKILTQMGSDVMAVTGDINYDAERVKVEEAQQIQTWQQSMHTEQMGIALGVSMSAIDAAKSAVSTAEAMDKTKSTRAKAMGTTAIAFNAYNAYNQVNVQDIKQIFRPKISLSFSSSSSDSSASGETNIARDSSIQAGGKVSFKTHGAKEDQHIKLQGAQVGAGDAIYINTEGKLDLLASQKISTQRSQNSSNSSSVGVSYNGGWSVDGSYANGGGKRDGTDISYNNMHLNAGKHISIKTGGEAVVKGTVAKAEKITLDLGGNWVMESLQDSSGYNVNQQNVSVSGAIGVGSSVSLGLGKTDVNSNYKSVKEQTGFKAADGGFNVKVVGDANLKGAVITSTDKVVKDGKNTFEVKGKQSFIDMQNEAKYTAEGVGVNVSVGSTPSAEAGYGADDGRASSTTKAGVSGIITSGSHGEVRTSDKEAGIDKIFDAQQVTEEMNAQVVVTKEFGKDASKFVGDYAQKWQQQADILRREAREMSDPVKKKELWSEADELDAKWGDGGYSRILLHMLIGGLTGGIEGAVGAGSGSLTAPLVADILKDEEIEVDAKKIMIALASVAAGAAMGNVAGGVSGLNEVGNNYLLHSRLKDEESLLTELKKKQEQKRCDDVCKKEIRELEALDKRRDEEIKPLVDACEKAGRKKCKAEAISRHYGQSNGMSDESMRREGFAGSNGSPFSFNDCYKNDKGGCSYGPLQIAANSGMMGDFLNDLKNNPSVEAQHFHRSLVQAGGVEAAKRGDQKFFDAWMDLTSEDPQFVQYQIDSLINRNFYPVVKNLERAGIEYESLPKSIRESLFSGAVQHGSGVDKKATRGLDNVTNRAIVAAEEEDPSPATFHTYTKEEYVYGQTLDQIKGMEEDQAKLIKKRESLITQQKSLITQQLEIERKKNALLEQGIRSPHTTQNLNAQLADLTKKADGITNEVNKLTPQVDKLKSKVDLITGRVDNLNPQVNELTEQIDSKAKKMDEPLLYLREHAGKAFKDGERFIREFYKARTEMYPKEAARYKVELESILKKYKEELKAAKKVN